MRASSYDSCKLSSRPDHRAPFPSVPNGNRRFTFASRLIGVLFLDPLTGVCRVATPPSPCPFQIGMLFYQASMMILFRQFFVKSYSKPKGDAAKKAK